MLKLKVIQGLIWYNIIKKLRSFDKKHTFSKYYRANTARHTVKVDTVLESVKIDKQ